MATLEIIQIDSREAVVRDVRVLDVITGELSAETDVHVIDGIIKSIGRQSSGAGVPDIPGGGMTLMPGLIDCHSHILSPFLSKQEGNNILASWIFRQIGRNLRTHLAAGVVAVRDMLSVIRVMNKVRWLIERGRIHGPEIIASGALLSCRDGYPEFIHPLKPPLINLIGTPKYELSTPAAAAKAVRLLKKSGANLIKVGYSTKNRDNEGPDTMKAVSFEVLDAICKEAHSLGLIVSVHHNWGEDIPKILRADVDTLEHQPCDEIISDEHVELIKRKGIRMVPTLTVTHNMSYFDKKQEFHYSPAADELFEPEARDHLRFISDTWLDFSERSYQDVFGFWRANPDSYHNAKESARKLHAAGVPLMAGTDFGAVVSYSGELQEELQRLTLIGMSNIEAIRAGTCNAAELLGIAGSMGSIEPGKKAAFILIDGNPLEDITALKRIRMIAKGGHWYKPAGDTGTPFWNENHPIQ